MKKLDDKYIWIDCYTYTNCGNFDFQVELNKEYSLKEDKFPILNKCGFECYKTLKDVFKFYSFNYDSKFLKCKAHIPVIQQEYLKDYKCGKDSRYRRSSYTSCDELVGDKIIFIEDISRSREVYEIIKNDYKHMQYDDFTKIINREDYINSLREYAISKMSLMGYSKPFSDIYLAKCISLLADECSTFRDVDCNPLIDCALKKAQAYVEEGLSKDMRAYLLMK